MSKKKVVLSLIVAFVCFIPLAAKAFTIKSGESVYYPKDQIVDGNLYIAASNITVEGQVNGDIICVGQVINISAKVDGDIICAGQNINISGEVLGNTRLAGNTVNLSGTVGRNLNVAASSLIISEQSKVGWDVLTASVISEVRGDVGGNLHGATSNLLISGYIGKNVDIKIDGRKNNKNGDNGKMTITETAKINGDVIYTAFNDGEIFKDNVQGQIIHNFPKDLKDKVVLAFIWGKIYSIFAALLVGLLILTLWRRQILAISESMKKKISENIGWGAVMMFLPPIAALILLFTFIGIPLSLILIASWITFMFIAKIIFAVMAGSFLLKKVFKHHTHKLFLEMTVGVVVFWFIFAIPIIGWLLSLIASWWAMGAIWNYLRKNK